MRPAIQTKDLFDFAYLPNGWDDVRKLVALAAPESWAFKRSGNVLFPDIEILVHYLKEVFYRLSTGYLAAGSLQEAMACVYIQDGISCINTGLHTGEGKEIFMLLRANDGQESACPWIFDRYAAQDDPVIQSLSPRPASVMALEGGKLRDFDPDASVFINYRVIAAKPECVQLLPENARDYSNMRKGLQRAVDIGRRRAKNRLYYVPGIACRSGLMYVMPLYLTKAAMTGCALLLEQNQDGLGYLAQQIISVGQAYVEARLLGPVETSWLLHLVKQPPSRPYYRGENVERAVVMQ